MALLCYLSPIPLAISPFSLIFHLQFSHGEVNTKTTNEIVDSLALIDTVNLAKYRDRLFSSLQCTLM